MLQQSFTLPELIDYELQIALDLRLDPSTLEARDQIALQYLDILKAGKIASLQAWLRPLRRGLGERFLAGRQTLLLFCILLGAVMGAGSIQGLLTYDGSQPVNIIPFLLLFVVLPLLLLLLLLLRAGLVSVLKKVPRTWTTGLARMILQRSLRSLGDDAVVWDLWRRLKELHPRLFALQAWMISQSFALSFYMAALLSFLGLLAVNDYAFAWRTTLDLGPEGLARIVQILSLPFAELLPSAVPSLELIQGTQFNRFEQRYPMAGMATASAAWWPFLALVMLVYACLPRLLLAFYFPLQIGRSLKALPFDDLASENLWLRLQKGALRWQAGEGTQAVVQTPIPSALPQETQRDTLVVRWRNAPFAAKDLRDFLQTHGLILKECLNADGRDAEQDQIIKALAPHQALTIVCDPWELPGESLDRLRLRIRKELSPRLPIFFAPLQKNRDGLSGLSEAKDLLLWRQGISALGDPFVALLKNEGFAP